MGDGKWDKDTWTTYATTHVVGKNVEQIYNQRFLHDDLNPSKIKLRESRDSKSNPNSNAIIIGQDVTGSMDPVLHELIENALPKLFEEIYSRKPIPDPHVMLNGIGDVLWDKAPLQVTQFEADIRIADQLKRIFIERGGGGNTFESYILPWLFAAMRTSIDCWEKRQHKGYLFTIGDECPTPMLRVGDINRVMGDNTVATDFTNKEILAMVSQRYHVYHIMIEQGDYMSRNSDRVVKEWTALLGQQALRLSDYTKLAEVIVSAIQINEGADVYSVLGSWDTATSKVITDTFIREVEY